MGMSNSQINIKQSESLNRDELSDCLILLWSNKKIIFLSACFFIICAFIYISQKKIIWNVNGLISVEISNDRNIDYLKSHIDGFGTFSDDTLLDVYKKEFSSLDNKVSFLKQYDYDDSSINNLSINNVNKINYEISFINHDKNNIYKILTSYNEYISNISLKKSRLIILNKVSDYNDKLKYDYNKLLIKTKNNINIEKERIKYAIKIAQAAKIIIPEPYVSNNNDIFNINLGVLGLKEKLNIYSSDKILPIIEPKLITLKNENEKISEILISEKNNIIDNPYIIKTSKVQPLQSTSKSFIMMVSLVLGIIFGSFLIVIVDFIKNFKK
jgi:LPS O-antigen subunit length determinant protein (WzzB/FepE family)